MARKTHRLTAVAIRNATRPGMYADGAGLYLRVGPTGAQSWAFRFMERGKSHEMGLGPLHTVGLAEARALALDCRRKRLAGVNPLTARHAARTAEKVEAAKTITFRCCASQYIDDNWPAWRNAKHAAQWTATLETYAYPLIGGLPVAAIDTGMVAKILRPIWATKSETATRVRGRIEAVLDYARTHGWTQNQNPARWKGHLENILPARSKVAKVEHHAALPWKEIGGFMALLRGQAGIAARALEFTILTAARTGEVLAMTWAEVSLAEAVWTIPATRMKAGKEHRVPLSASALAVLGEMAKLRTSADPAEVVFPGAKPGRPLSNMAMLVLLRRMGRGDLTAHGFRSTFRDWVAEATGYPREVAEAALAHTLADKVEAAYRRGDLLDKRRQLMAEWSDFCAQVVPAEKGRMAAQRAKSDRGGHGHAAP